MYLWGVTPRVLVAEPQIQLFNICFNAVIFLNILAVIFFNKRRLREIL